MSVNNGTVPASVYGNNNNNNIEMDAPTTNDPCTTRCCKEWGQDYPGWFSLQEGSNTLDVAASFGATTWLARLWKLVTMAWLTSTLIYKWWSLRGDFWFFLAYLTHWSLIFSVVWSIASFANSVVPPKQPAANSTPSVWIKFCWLTFEVAAQFTLVVTLLFWTVEYDYGGGPPTYMNIMVHGGSFVLTWIEGLWINRIPVRWKHVMLVMFLATLYIIWTVIHQLATDIGNPRTQDEDPDTNDDLIYTVLDYQGTTGMSIGLCIAVVFVALPLIHWVLWLLSLYNFPCGGCSSGINRRYLSVKSSSTNDGSSGMDDNDNIYEEP